MSEISVRLPVCKLVDCDKTRETYANILTPPHERPLIPFTTRRIVGGGDPFYLKFWVKLTLLERTR